MVSEDQQSSPSDARVLLRKNSIKIRLKRVVSSSQRVD
jgi:hypothetical protein